MTSNATNNPYSYFSYAEYMTLHIVFCIVSVIGLLGNSFILILFVRYPTLRATDSFYRMGCLAFADWLTCFGLLIYAFNSLRFQLTNFFEFERLYCLLLSSIYTIGIIMSHVFTLSIAHDRYLATKEPLSYRSLDHKKRVIYWIVAGLAVVLLLMIPYFIGYQSYTDVPSFCSSGAAASRLFSLTNSFVNVTIGIIIYILYGLALHAQHAGLQMQSGVVSDLAMRRQKAVNKVVLRILMVYTATIFLPLVIMLIITELGLVTPRYSPYLALIIEFNSIGNVFIYLRKHEQFRKHAKRLLGIKDNAVMPKNFDFTANVSQQLQLTKV